jgi:hypothetical protein
MLDDLWSKLVTNQDGLAGRSELLLDIATAMGNRETLWIPAALYEGREKCLEYLIAVGILTRTQDGKGVGFVHQTLFEHAWARAFAREKVRLSDYVLARQDGLFVRPIAWAGLTYLRGADPTSYRREFGALWGHAQLRLHLRHLLVEFLGTVPEVDPQEKSWLFEALAVPELVTRVLTAVRGNRGWFLILAEGYLRQIMRNSEQDFGPVVALLAAAWPVAPKQCLSLLRDVWLPDPKRDAETWSVLNNLSEWDEAAADVVYTILGRTSVNRGAVLHLASQVLESSPPLAVRIVTAAFAHELDVLESEPEPTPPPLPEDATETARAVQHLTFRAGERFCRLFQDHQGWYGIEELAERAPREFLSEMWPLFIRALGHILKDTEIRPTQFRRNYCLGLEFSKDEEDAGRYPLPGSLALAVTTVAKQMPDAFLAFLATERKNDSETVQRLLARGLVELIPAHREIVLQFLLEDSRRLQLGSHSDEFEDSLRLLQALAPTLTDSQFANLASLILHWSPIDARKEDSDAEYRFAAHKFNRRRRLRLLKVMPAERLSSKTRALLSQEETVFPDHSEAGVIRTEGGFIGSPMSAEQMSLASNEDIIRLFDVLKDSTHSTHPRHLMRGGSSQASSEFERFSTSSPERAVEIVKHFRPAEQERPAAAAVMGIAKSPFPDHALFSLILDLDARGFGSEEFRVDISRALRGRLKDNVGLPDSMCALLERWLAHPWSVRERPQRVDGQEDAKLHGILWQRYGMTLLPYGNYYLLETLSYGYLMRATPAAEKWLSALEAHLLRDEQPEAWQALCRELPHLARCDHDRAERFLERLFERFPDVLQSQYGASLLSHAWWYASEPLVWKWLYKLRHGSWPLGAQAYGELIALRTLVRPEDDKAQWELASLLRDEDDDAGLIKAGRIGVAFTSVNMWGHPETREAATVLLLWLIPNADANISKVILQALTQGQSLPGDDSTHRLLEAVANHPHVLASLENTWFLEHLEALLPYEPKLVFHISKEIVELRSRDLNSLQSGWSMHSANLTNIALTLHRLAPPNRSMGLELFEALLGARLPDAELALREIDQRLPFSNTGAVLRRRPGRRGIARRTA